MSGSVSCPGAREVPGTVVDPDRPRVTPVVVSGVPEVDAGGVGFRSRSADRSTGGNPRLQVGCDPPLQRCDSRQQKAPRAGLIRRSAAARMRMPAAAIWRRRRGGHVRSTTTWEWRRALARGVRSRGPMTTPLVVVESANPAAAEHVRRALARAQAAGWRVVAGWLAPRGRVVCHGAVASDADAVLALRAALDGAGVVILAGTPRPTTDRLIDNLRRLGSVEHVAVDEPARAPVDVETRRLLQLLAEGWTLGEAAAELGLSRRTADRRLDAARRMLGAEHTADALAAARRLGWLDPIGAAD